MTTFKISKFLVAAGIAIAVSASATGVHAGANSPARIVKPLAGLSFPVGSKHAVGYFVPGRSGCELTLLVGESGDSVSDREKGAAPARLTTLVGAGRTARIDTAEGQSVEFFCSTGASFLTTRVIDRVAYATINAR